MYKTLIIYKPVQAFLHVEMRLPLDSRLYPVWTDIYLKTGEMNYSNWTESFWMWIFFFYSWGYGISVYLIVGSLVTGLQLPW